MNNLEKLFKDFNEELVLWNSVADQVREPVSLETKIKQQREYYLSEVDELSQAKDFIEEIDAICDIYFTEEYLHIMSNSNAEQRTYLIVANKFVNEGRITPEKLSEALSEVFRSNWSKYPKTEEIDQLYELEYISDKIGQPVQHKTVMVEGELRSVFLDLDNKVRKPSTFSEPDLGSIL